VPRCKRKQGDIPGLLDGACQAALVRGANAREPTGHNLAALSHKPLQQTNVAVRNRVNFFRAELADFLAAEKLSAAARTTAGTTAALRTTATGPSRRPIMSTLWCCARFRRLSYCLISHFVSSSTLSLRNSHQGIAMQMDRAVTAKLIRHRQ
jgi:hypothetical protein